MNHVWKKIWPECIKTTDAEVNFLPEVRQNILDLAHDLGFEDLNESDVLDLLAADREPLSYEELIQLQAEPAIDEDAEPVVSKQLTSKIMSTVSVICVVSVCIAAVFSFPDGAPVDACVKSRPNQPNHGSARPQEPHTRPYRVIASHQHYGPGSQITVTISGDVFRGFFIQARDAATNNWVGSWVESPGSKVHPECSSITHGDPRDKQQATLVWQAPHDAQPGQVYFTGTVLKDYGTFWSNIIADVPQQQK
ncbi:putative defense protein 3 [Ctenocephalides felis]|uniref:putative defense protein 3 n=1 Tax=Ctenocephalides felis TaxID=7515 RepID=UPI000E6E1CD2|nr:putative defense protein 3 [Ctenocephalides felis]